MGLMFYFFRHGETESSRIGGYCGDLDMELTHEGRQMSEDFAAGYKSLQWSGIFCSSLRRCRDTAKPLSAAVGLEIQIRDGLREISYGQWEGKPPEEVSRRFHDEYVRWMVDPGWNRPSGGERGVDVARRSASVLNEIERKHASGNVLVVSHKATIRIMIYLNLSVGGILTLYAARTRGPFWSVLPAKTLLVVTFGAQAAATLISVYGFLMQPIGWSNAGIVWGYSFVLFLLQDQVKLAARKIFNEEKHSGYFGRHSR